MKDKDKTKEQFLKMLRELRQRQAELEKSKARRKRKEKEEFIIHSLLSKKE